MDKPLATVHTLRPAQGHPSTDKPPDLTTDMAIAMVQVSQSKAGLDSPKEIAEQILSKLSALGWVWAQASDAV